MATALAKNKTTRLQDGLKETKNILFDRECHRCGGLMITDHCFDVASNTGEFEIEIRKCLSCGETIDPTILSNRIRADQQVDSVGKRLNPKNLDTFP